MNYHLYFTPRTLQIQSNHPMFKMSRIRSYKAYCDYHPRCVRCGAGHQISDCPNPRNAPLKCAFCSENHLANYKSCSIYRNLKRRKKPTSKSNILTNNTRYKSSNAQSRCPLDNAFFNKHPSSDQPKTPKHTQHKIGRAHV